MNDTCQTKYPILLVHGVGFRDLSRPLYWGRIPYALTEHGASVFYGGQDSWATIEENGAFLAKRIEAICRETGAEKLNIIAHSKGGLDARMAITSCHMAHRVASLTTVSTPHRGSKTIDMLLQAPKRVFNLAAFAVNNWSRLCGDHKPDFLAVCEQFSAAYMVSFNRSNPDAEGVFYQSLAGVMRRPFSDFFLWIANAVVSHIEGENDGLVSLSSARWGARCIELRGASGRGVSHLDEIDGRRLPLRLDSGVCDIVDVYLYIAEDLKNRGY